MSALWSPETDTHITARYGLKTLDQKARNKAKMQKNLGWPEEPRRATLCLPLGMTEALGGSVLKAMLPGLLTQSVEILILGKGSKEYGAYFTELQKSHGHRIAILPPTEASLHTMIAAADIALFLHDATGVTEVQTCLQYGVVPVVTGGDLENYDPVQERGNAFIFEQHEKPELTAWSAFAALTRALETFKFPYDWRTIQRHCMVSGK